MVPRAVLMKSGLVSINTARQNILKTAVSVNTTRQVNTAHSKITVNVARPMSYLSKTTHSTVKRPINNNTTFKNSNINQIVNTVRSKNVNTARPKAVVNVVKGNNVNAVKAFNCLFWKPKTKIQVSDGLGPQKKLIFLSDVQGNPQMNLQDKRVIDSGCSRHMTGNMSYLTDYEEIVCEKDNVALEGTPKEGKSQEEDETSGILKSFITGIENLVDHKVKVIRTLIEAARTMLADSKLPTTFWAEAVNTTCYVQNRVLVVKPHNKTPYERFHGRTPTLSFMRPFGCPVTILNTIDHLGKFDGKADEGFFVGYSLNSKAFRVFNSRTRIVEENLHIRFSKNTPNVVGSGPDWLFDIDALTRTMNYEPIVTDLKSSQDDGSKPSSDDEKKVDEDPRKDSESIDQEKDDNVSNTNNDNGLHQAPRAWYETLLTYLLDSEFQRGKINKTLFIKKYKGDILLVQVYVDDIIFGSTKKEICNAFEKLMHEKFQMSSMRELTFFLGLQKFGFTEVKTASTPIETQKPLLKDENGEKVDVHMYRSMIGSLMYLTSLRPDIMFAVCACARYQVNPKVSHLHAVKRIFIYLKGQQKLGLWYPKDSPFDLVAYTDSDYAGASLDRKSTTGGCQFLGCRLISWQCKKQTVVANSTIEAEYVAASSCYG
ncbi:uncharacterized mitochondrial protein-like protein [Tanacetum coccineum]|uniref:Uncharacterized mitochondrial protein-like protein n=1 Tax=Tanacetum coccineum TaxID=301880 RepID=A0ABQ5CX06_9ASTR